MTLFDPLSRSSEDGDCARLKLISNLCNYSHHLDEFYSKLQSKMRNDRKRVHGFPMHHEMIFTFSPDTSDPNIYIRNDNTNVSDPTDIQISYRLNLILVSDYEGSKIEVFDLETKKHKNSIFPLPQEKPRHFCIEENYDGQNNEAIILCCKDDILKYDLKQFLTIGKQEVGKIWASSKCDWAQGLAISYSTRQLYVCDHGQSNIVILNLISGEFVYQFPVNEAFGLALTNDEQYLVVTQVNSCNTVQIFKKESFNAVNGETEWKSIKTLGIVQNEHGSKFHNPCAVIFDRFSRNLLVCDNGNRRIQVFSFNTFEPVGVFGDVDNQFFRYFPYSLCLNELTGELLVCQCEECF
ncbi:hypothetical protein C9374_001796 [Naegleria lovaniensis]|uniref:Uncharacterized protein n=1 Tax=Naegleria lovaniensis TaxID=51637 RepID=A0AA88GWM5_NAELO|nr:uncharacterized protein C9374_001796 [Naegleria lovaniensis]KAG2387464.1 hypothetical protein C9374_001796 [Naegleria lovaniensis]